MLYKKKHEPWNKGIKSPKMKELWQNPEYLEKMVKRNKKTSEDMKINNPMKNIKTRRKVGKKVKEAWETGKIDLRGEKSGLWKGGVSRTYCHRIMKENLNLIQKCQICDNNKVKLEIHHKDFNCKNNNLNNLIIVCRSCHNKIHKRIPPIKKKK